MMQLHAEDYARAEAYLAWSAQRKVLYGKVQPVWLDEDRFWYGTRTQRGYEYFLVDPVKGTKGHAFDHPKLAATLSIASGQAVEPYQLPIWEVFLDNAISEARFNFDGKQWSVDLRTYRCAEQEEDGTRAEEICSPDGKWGAFMRDHNIWVRDIQTSEEIQLTQDGVEYYAYGVASEGRTTAVQERLTRITLPPVVLWSPDSSKILTHKLDERQVLDLHLLQHVPPDGQPRPVLHTYKYSMVGDEHLPMAEYVVVDIEQRSMALVQLEPIVVPIWSPISAQEVWWGDDGEHAYIIVKKRGSRELILCEVQASNGKTRTIITETGESLVELNLSILGRPNVRVLKQSGSIVWFSQRDGWAHLYLYDLQTGLLKNQITEGTFVVRDILFVDQEEGWVYYAAGGREPDIDPYFRLLYRSRLDGSATELLSPEDADHEVTVSPSGRFFVDTYSHIDLPPVTVVRDNACKPILELETVDIQPIMDMGWQLPERFSVKAADAVTEIYGAMFFPSHFDPEQSYPVIESIYPGPQGIRTPKSFFVSDVWQSLNFWNTQALAELGFIVVTIDGRGTPLRSKSFHNQSYGNLHETGNLADHVAGIRQLAMTRPYMDLGRVGIYGHSGGGNATTRALFEYGDFYHVGVASAGNHDQLGYISAWGEQYQGMLDGDNYNRQANWRYAHQLKGKLLLIYGDMDDNVHPAMTVRVIDALIKANKDFDLLVMPNRHHIFVDDPYYIRRLWDYFVTHLLNVEPPSNYRIIPPAPAPWEVQ